MTQLLYPVADIIANSWTPSSGSDLYAMLDESSASDADYIRSPDDPDVQRFEVLLGSGTGAASSTGNELHLRLEAINYDTSFDFELVCGTTVLDGWTENVLASAGVVARTKTFGTGVLTSNTDNRVRGIARRTGLTTYYVDATGGSDSNNGTTTSTPWQSLNKVNAMYASYDPGDTICLKRGETWTGEQLAVPCSGSSGLPITFTAYGEGERPIISGISGYHGIHFDGSQYLIFSNMIVEDWGYDGLYLANCYHVKVVNVLARSNTRDGFGVEAALGSSDSDDIKYYYCEATLSGRVGFGSTFRDSAGSVGIWYFFCKATYCGQAMASHGFTAYYSQKVHFRYCEAAFTNINPGTGLPNAYTTEGHGICYDDFAHNGSVMYCYCHDNQGAGIGAAHQANNNVAAYNLVIANGAQGIFINGDTGGSANTLVYNNTIIGNAWDGIDFQGICTGGILKNNLCADNGMYGIKFQGGAVSSYTVATNLVYNNTNGGTVGVTGATGTVTSDPDLDADYVPISGSPAINAGLNIGSTYDQGLKPGSVWPLAVQTVDQDSYSSWEIGAYVYV